MPSFASRSTRPADRPACLFLHGSGTGKSSEAFGDVANAMASAGITTLVPDKRLDNYTMLHRDYVSSAHDYAKSLEILRKWPGVSRSETGIYAESEGTWIATVLTQQHPDLAFAILTSPPVVSGRQQMTLAATNYLTAAGAPDAVKQLIPRITSLGTQRMGLAYADFDAAKYRRSLTMPLLINYGVKDTAMPVEQGARLLIKAANQAGNTNVTLRYYEREPSASNRFESDGSGTAVGTALHARSGGLDQRGDERHGCERLGNADDRRNAAESDGHGTAEDPARAGEVDGCDCRRQSRFACSARCWRCAARQFCSSPAGCASAVRHGGYRTIRLRRNRRSQRIRLQCFQRMRPHRQARPHNRMRHVQSQ